MDLSHYDAIIAAVFAETPDLLHCNSYRVDALELGSVWCLYLNQIVITSTAGLPFGSNIPFTVGYTVAYTYATVHEYR